MGYTKKSSQKTKLYKQLAELNDQRDRLEQSIRKSRGKQPELHADLRHLMRRIENVKFKIENGGKNSIPGVDPAPNYVINSNSK